MKTKTNSTPVNPSPSTAPSTATAPPATPITGSASKPRGKRVELQASLTTLISGLQATFQPTEVIPLKTGTQTCAQLVAFFTQLISAAETTKSSNKTWRQDVVAERQLAAQIMPMRMALRGLLASRFNEAQMLDFGFVARKRSKPTSTTVAAGVAKAAATRKARGTKGSKQKAEITGNVTGVVITPVTSGPIEPAAATPVAPAAPAASAAAPASPAPAVKPATATS